MKRVVLIKLWAIGDIVMTTPVLKALRAAYPGIQITWVVDEENAEVLRSHPEIDALEPIASGAWRRLRRKGRYISWLRETQRLRERIARYQPDAVLNCHPENWWSATLCPAPIRVGLYPTARLTWTRRFYTHPLPRTPGLHNTEHYLLMTRALGCPDADYQMSIGQTPEEETFFTRFQQEHSVDPCSPLIVLAPFSTAENRNWEAERCARVADWLTERYKAQIVLTYAPRDAEKATGLIQQIEALAAKRGGTTRLLHPGRTSLRDYISLIRHADLVFCMDSSAMHLAAATGTPYLALFGATPVSERVPLRGAGKVLFHPLPCAPCDRTTCTHPEFRACMNLLSVKEVQEAMEEQLGVLTI